MAARKTSRKRNVKKNELVSKIAEIIKKPPGQITQRDIDYFMKYAHPATPGHEKIRAEIQRRDNQKIIKEMRKTTEQQKRAADAAIILAGVTFILALGTIALAVGTSSLAGSSQEQLAELKTQNQPLAEIIQRTCPDQLHFQDGMEQFNFYYRNTGASLDNIEVKGLIENGKCRIYEYLKTEGDVAVGSGNLGVACALNLNLAPTGNKYEEMFAIVYVNEDANIFGFTFTYTSVNSKSPLFGQQREIMPCKYRKEIVEGNIRYDNIPRAELGDWE